MNDDAKNTSKATGVARVRELSRNPISIIGMAVAVVALGNILFLFFVDATRPHPSPYVGILAYMVAPAFLALGLAMIIFGMLYYRRTLRESARRKAFARFLQVPRLP